MLREFFKIMQNLTCNTIKKWATVTTLATTLAGCAGTNTFTGGMSASDNLITSRTVNIVVSNPQLALDVVRRGKGMQGVDAPRPFMGMAIAPTQIISDTGSDVLLRDGNAVDAVIAMAFMQAVTRPHVAGLGSQGMCLVSHSQIGLAEVLDFTTPLSHMPTLPRGMAILHSRYGADLWANLILPAEKQARRGIMPSDDLIKTASILPNGINGVIPTANVPLYRDRLSLTLSLLRLQGGGALYSGQGLNLLYNDAKRVGITLSKSDLKSYQPKWQTALSVQAGDYTVYTVGRPFDLGTPVAQTLSLMGKTVADNPTERQAQIKTALSRVNSTAFKSGVKISNTALMAVDDEGLAVICQPTLNAPFGAGAVTPNLGMTLPQKSTNVAYLPLIGVDSTSKFKFMTSPVGQSVTLYDAVHTTAQLATSQNQNFNAITTENRTWTNGEIWYAETAETNPEKSPQIKPSGTQINGILCPSALPSKTIACTAGTDPRGTARIKYAGFDSGIVAEK